MECRFVPFRGAFNIFHSESVAHHNHGLFIIAHRKTEQQEFKEKAHENNQIYFDVAALAKMFLSLFLQEKWEAEQMKNTLSGHAQCSSAISNNVPDCERAHSPH